MEISIKRVVLYRVFELLTISTILSTVCSAVEFLGIIKGESQIGFLMLVAAMIFFVATIVTMITYYQDESDVGVYLLSNVVAYVIFAAISLLATFVANYFDANILYVWFFSVTTAIRMNDTFNLMGAMLIFHGICIIPVFCLPPIMRAINSKYQY